MTQKSDGHWVACDKAGQGIGDNIALVRDLEPALSFLEAVARQTAGPVIQREPILAALQRTRPVSSRPDPSRPTSGSASRWRIAATGCRASNRYATSRPASASGRWNPCWKTGGRWTWTESTGFSSAASRSRTPAQCTRHRPCRCGIDAGPPAWPFCSSCGVPGDRTGCAATSKVFYSRTHVRLGLPAPALLSNILLNRR